MEYYNKKIENNNNIYYFNAIDISILSLLFYLDSFRK